MIRVLVVDDSAYNRVTLSRMLESHSRIKVVGTAIDGEDAIKQVLRTRPDVITLDLEMPVMDGFSFLRWLMANLPTAVVAVSSKSSDRSVFKALELGAMDFIAKPGGRVSTRLPEIERDLQNKILQVVELRIDNLKRRVADDEKQHEPVTAPLPEVAAAAIELVAIGASTGGPPALQQVFQSLPRLGVPFVVAQHMPPTFTSLFAERMNRVTEYEVREGVDGEQIQPNTVYIAAGGMQTEVRRGADGLYLRVLPSRQEDLYAPSVDRLFKSASEACTDKLLAVVLTGMGEDGSHAIGELHERGGRTVAESADTAIVFGMPAAAVKTGAVDEVVPLPAIAGAIQRICSGG